jgi:hypothetical protein
MPPKKDGTKAASKAKQVQKAKVCLHRYAYIELVVPGCVCTSMRVVSTSCHSYSGLPQVVEDKTFGLKNKNKSSKVQK